MVPGTASKAGQFQQCYTNSQGLNLFLNLINNVSTRQDDATGANLIMVQVDNFQMYSFVYHVVK